VFLLVVLLNTHAVTGVHRVHDAAHMPTHEELSLVAKHADESSVLDMKSNKDDE
jgi:hypothetical protein